MNEFNGLFAASISVFDENRNVDMNALEALIEYYVKNRFDGAFFVSSTGEYFSTAPEKRVEMTAAAVRLNGGRIKILSGVSEDYWDGVKANIDAMSATGVDGLMLMPPRFTVYSQEELIDFYTKAADYCPVPLFIYNHMTRLNNKLTVDTVETLSHHSNIAGIKDTHNDHMRLTEVLHRMGNRDDFSIFSGGDAIAGLTCLMGGNILNALSPIIPNVFHEMIEAGKKSDVKKVMELQLKVNKLMRIFSVIKASPTANTASFSQGVKVAMMRHVPCTPYLSQLGVNITEEDYRKIQAIVDESL